IIPLSTLSYATKHDLATWSTNDNINIDNAAAITNSAGGVTINSLRTDAGGVYTLTFSGATTIASGGVLIEGTTTSTVTFAGAGASAAIVGNNTSNRAFVFGPGGAIIRGGAGTVILNGPMSGIGQFTRFGVGGWTSIFGSKTYTGSTVVGAGTLDIDVIANSGQPSGLGTGADVATIQLGNGNASCLNYSGLVNASTDRPIALSANSQIIRVENNATPVNLTLSGAMSGTFSLQKLGTGTLTITGSKTYSGPLTIGKGDLSIDSPGGLGTGATANAATITLGNTNTATLTFTGASGTSSRPFTLNPQAGQFGAFEATTGTLTLTGGIDTNGKALAFDGAGSINVNSAIIGAGSL